MANFDENRVNTTISPADQTTLDTASASLMLVLEPYLKALTEDERKSLFSLKEENMAFASDALEQAESLGSLFPTGVGSLITNLATDLQLNQQMAYIDETFVAQLQLKVTDTRRLAAHEAYVGALAIYKIIEAMAAVGVPGAQAAYNILKVRFANQGGAPQQPTP